MREDRRRFLKSIAAAGVAAGPSAALSGSDQREYSPPVIGPSGSLPTVLGRKTGLKIKSIETFTQGKNLSIVRIRTNDGAEGYGQVAPYDADITASVMHRKIAPLVLGQDPADLEAFVDRSIEENYKFPWSFVCRGLAGIDTAVWDLLGKREGKTVCELLGGKVRPMAVYGSSMSRTIKPEDEARRLVQLRDSRGFRAFKVRIGKVCGHDQDQWPGRTEALIPAVHRELGDKVLLKADGNSCYTPPKAILVGRTLEDHGFSHFEEPCPYWELEWTAQVAAALRIPVAGGEQDNDLAQWQRMISMHAVDIVQPDICYLGGVTRTLRVAAMAAKAGMKCVPHSANLSMLLVFTLHVMGAIPNAGPHIEFTIENDSWTRNLYQPAPEVNEGKVAIPAGPGWGVTLNSEWLAKARREVSEQTGA